MTPISTASAGPAPAGELERARHLVQEADRSAARLVHCLDALARPVETPEEVVEAGLAALSDAFRADVVCLVRTGDPTSRGLARDVAAFTHGLPGSGWFELPELPGALASPSDGLVSRSASWSAADDGGRLVVRGVEVLAGARLSPRPEDPTSGSVLVLRRDPTAFTDTEVQLLSSVVERLLSAARGAESRRRGEVLARAGTVMRGHRDPLTPALAQLVAGLAGSTWAGVVGLAGDQAALAGEHGAALVPGCRWPVEPGAAERDAPLDVELLVHDAAVPAGVLQADLPVRSVLRVPVVLDGRPHALLVAVHADPGAFSPVVVDAVRTLAHSTASALESSQLYAALERSEQTSRHSATHDALTGLANRALVREELERRLARPDGAGQVGVLFCDLDGFKAVNDRHGHDAGDQVLRQVASRVQAALRPDDLLARLGGDEFVALVDGAPSEDVVAAVGERLLRAVARPVDVVSTSGRSARVSVGGCIGGAIAQRGVDAASRTDAVLRNADAAMYEAKRAGGHQVRVYDEAAAATAQRLHELDADLSSAVEDGTVEVHYQPVWDLVADRAVGVEALARWQHPVHGRVGPDEFIPIAERSGTITALGALVLERACADLVGWGPAAGALSLSVNASPVELRAPGFAVGVLAALARHGLTPSRLAVEVTEGLPLGGTEVEQIAALRAAGVRVVVDDFGVSHSDLARLKSLPVDGLKIDRSLVSGLSHRPDAHPLDRGLVEAILVVARAGGLTVVAEGVETAEEREVLVSLGCRTAQGWLTGRPVPADQAPRALALPEPTAPGPTAPGSAPPAPPQPV